ncbi:MAG: glycosyltransferase family 9 protein [Tagaea sp.]|nr:glycosyltransferase family 9 protein [Tagaea sp.]
MSLADYDSVLAIKLGALGDVVQSFGPVRAIRQAHPKARLIVLTAPAFADLFAACPDVDEVWRDDRPHKFDLFGLLRLRARLRGGKFRRVYDLQTSSRSNLYFKLMGPRRPEWSGIAPGCSHPHANPDRDSMHTVDRQREQLAMAGIDAVPETELAWLDADISAHKLPDPCVLLVPGGAPTRPKKRWPVAKYAALAQELVAHGATPVVIGGTAEAALGQAIRAANPRVRDLTGKTSFAEIAALARQAGAAIGNDTGPMHLIARANCPSIVLFGSESDPALCAPRGTEVAVMRRSNLDGLGVDEVMRLLFKRAA